MAESVQTGGLKRFDYSEQKSSKLDDGRKKAIEDAYAAAEEREKKEKKNKWIFWIILALVLLLILGYFILKSRFILVLRFIL